MKILKKWESVRILVIPKSEKSLCPIHMPSERKVLPFLTIRFVTLAMILLIAGDLPSLEMTSCVPHCSSLIVNLIQIHPLRKLP